MRQPRVSLLDEACRLQRHPVIGPRPRFLDPQPRGARDLHRLGGVIERSADVPGQQFEFAATQQHAHSRRTVEVCRKRVRRSEHGPSAVKFADPVIVMIQRHQAAYRTFAPGARRFSGNGKQTRCNVRGKLVALRRRRNLQRGLKSFYFGIRQCGLIHWLNLDSLEQVA
jgi:hypothetical protein